MKIYSFLSQGAVVQPIEIQVHVRFQIPSFQILGLVGPEIQEARERVVSAFASSELEFPKKKVIVNLAPSDVKKSGTGHDLAIAVGVLHFASEPFLKDSKIYAWGALGLDGRVHASGKIASLMELLCNSQHARTPTLLYLSHDDAKTWFELKEWRKSNHLSLPDQTQIKVIRKLRDVMDEASSMPTFPIRMEKQKTPELLPLLSHQERILDLSIVGRHHTLVLGPKGVGKSQMLEWYRWLTPTPDPHKIWRRMLYADSAHHVPSLYSEGLPLRTVHAQIKPAHLLGSWGTRGFRAGELSLAHGGILVADEFLEWPRDAKECLREPLQNKKTTITRVQGTTEIACDFQLIATGNLCPCGGLPPQFRNGKKTSLKCRCHPGKVESYLERLSGPIADRIDLIAVLNEEIIPDSKGMSVSIDKIALHQKKTYLKERQDFALLHFGSIPNELSVQWLEKNLPSDERFEAVLKGRVMSLRARHKTLRLARTIQAMQLSVEFKVEHLFEALTYRFQED